MFVIKMKLLFSSVACLCVSLSVASFDTYRAGVINSHGGLRAYIPLIHDAGKSEVDIVVLPSPEHTGSEDNYDETVKELSKAAKEANLYVVAHLFEKVRCQNKNELIRSNLVFDRNGAVISVYRKSINNIANCTGTSSDLKAFSTDFGVKFSLLMEEDIALRNLGRDSNYVVTGAWSSEIPFLSAAQFSSAWAYTNKANLISNTGIYAGTSGLRTASDNLSITDLKKNGQYKVSIPPVTNPTNLRTYPDEDLSQYIIRPLDLAASSKGYKESVCHNKFCCEFYVKTSITGNKLEPNYGLAAFDGIRFFGRNHHIGTQNCAVFACAGLYKRTCAIGSKNSTDVIFDKITISANFTTGNTAHYPFILTTKSIGNGDFKLETTLGKEKQIVAELKDSSVLSFGINGRDFARDYETAYNLAENNAEGLTMDIYEYLYNEDVQEFFDYVWIRLRILILVVSIYILEMM